MKYCLSNSRNRFIIIINIYFNLVIIFVVKLVKWVLVQVRKSKCCFNESLKMLKTVLILLLQSVGFEWNNKMLVSTVNRIGDLSLTITKCIGPKTKPWVTPCSTLAQVDVVIL